MRKSILTILITLLVITSFAQKKILFDNTKNEQAKNADWVIDIDSRYPSPDQSGITQSTVETYWSGALSSWGVEMVKRGYYVETLPSSGTISYGNSSNAQDLSNYDIFVVCEPNNLFSATEKTAMINFVQNGGGLFIVSDHAGANRDDDIYDALEIWNDFFSTYYNPFGFTVDAGSDVSKDPATNVAILPSDQILHGAAGDVDGLAFYNGATFTINKTANSSAVGLVYMDGYSNTGTTGVMAVCATYGNGRVVAVGDSSVPEDITSNDGRTWNGWYQPFNAGNATGDDGVFMTNATIWLGESTTSPTLSLSTTSLMNFNYSPGNGPSASQSFSISGSNLDGSELTVTAPTNYEISSNNSSFSSSLNFSYTAPTLSSKTIYVRLKSGLSNGTFNGTLTCSENGSASSKTVSLSGAVNSNTNILNEDFSTCPSTNWTTYSVASNKNWACNTTDKAMSANGYQADVASDDWLISPVINLNTYSNEILTFDTWTKYTDTQTDPELIVKYSTNYPGTGNPESYTWTNLNYTFPAENSMSWTASDNIDLSAINSSNVYIAFQYISSGIAKSSSTLWEVDNVIITGEIAGTTYNISTSVSPVNSGTTSGSGTFSDGSSISLTATAQNGYRFVSWTENSIVVSTNSSYDITVTKNQNLIANFELITSIDEQKNNISIYPNPAKDIINLNISEIMPSTLIKIFDINGRKVFEKYTSNEKNILDISNLKSGMYIIQVNNDLINQKQKLIIR